MASPRRFLLYADGNSTSDGNITIDCIASCIGACVSKVCLPSPTTRPTSSPDTDDGYTPIELHRRNRHLPILMVTVTSAVAASFLLILALYAFFSMRRRRRRRRRHQHQPPPALAAAAANDDDDGDDHLLPGGGIEHHVWYIRTPGLDESMIASIASCVYKSDDGVVDSRDCSVCLGEFRDGEFVRLLPKCSHAFHLPCIDRWLSSHVNCPLCRAPIVSPLPAPVATAGTSPALPLTTATVATADPAESETRFSAPVENGQVEYSLPWEINNDGIEIGVVAQPSEGFSCTPSTAELPPSSSIDEKDLQPIRRSVSMDSVSVDAVLKEEEKEVELVQEGEVSVSANRGEHRGIQKGRKEMERSLSSQCSRWIFPRYGRFSNSILPL